MRLLFAGTPQTAVPSLRTLLDSRHDVVAVLTRPDAPTGRGRRVEPSPVRALAELAPDACPVVAYGGLIPPAALAVPPCGWVNLHFSLLPAWRGAAPVQHAILHGDDVTGATTFRIVAALDAGPVFGVVTEPIRPDETAGELLDRLAVSGAELLVATLDGIESGQLVAREQPADGVSLAPKINAEDARVRWGDPAVAIGRLVRARTPAPGAWTVLDGIRVKLWPFAGIGGGDQDLAPGELRVSGSAALVGTGTRPVQLGDVQPHGKRRMPAADWLRGLRPGPSGAVFG